MIRRSLTILALVIPSTLTAVTSGSAQAPLSAESRLLGSPVSAAPPAERNRTVAFGRSGSLRVALLMVLQKLDVPFIEATVGPAAERYSWVPLLGTRARLAGDPAPGAQIEAPAAPGVWHLETGNPVEKPLDFVTEVPFSAKHGGMLNGYYIGTYPTEGQGRTDLYAPPTGFIEVTAESQNLQLSDHFQIKQFLTKDQFNVWPKYVALNMNLIDKLELVLRELNSMGVRADRFHVMSGFRTPQYNGPGGDGRATLSRHMWGGAADVWVDNDDDGMMDDLNGDGRIDTGDSRVIERAVDRVEQKFPDLVGGCGIYPATSAHGPFTHIDARGYRARW